jgi:excinuclease ABC subunit A
LLRDPKLTLAEGAVLLWPSLDNALSRRMLQALAEGTGLSLDVPFEQLNARHRRIIFHGAGEEWFPVFPESATAPSKGAKGKAAPTGDGLPLFRFQFKGLYPALEEASRLSQ